MTVQRKTIFTAYLITVALILSACGAASNDSIIATSVAMTVQAKDTKEARSTPTELPGSPTSSVLASLTPFVTAGAGTQPVTPVAGGPTSSGPLCTAKASFVSETIPDGTLTNPGSTFTKTWRIMNTGTCTWNSSWKFVYVSGDLMGGATYYNFPQPAGPGDTVSVPVVFTAPADGGSYRGYWKIQSPWGLVFGDSGSGNAFWVDIVVGSGTPANNQTQTAYGVTGVTYETDVSLIRRCTPANTFYHYIAYVSSNGPVKVTYRWLQSDGNNANKGTLNFDSATTLQVSGDWSQGIASSTNPRWVQLTITSPTEHTYPQFTLPILCSQMP